MEVKLTDEQIDSLARPLVQIVTKFYEDPENKKKFQEWLQSRKRLGKEARH